MTIRLLLITMMCVLWLVAGSASAGDAARGKSIAGPCAACHGLEGNSVNPVWPKLAGMAAEYTAEQLKLFKQGTRKNVLMTPQAARLTEQDMKDLGAYFATIERSPAAADKKHIDLGKRIYMGGNIETGVPACISCHGPTGVGNPAAGYPNISYQHADYMAQRLKDYRQNKEQYPKAEIMAGVSKHLTDAEIEAVASYVQGLH